jgi:hypothetical protein
VFAVSYTPDIDRYQQIPLGGATGPYDCTAWSAAILVDAHTQGAIQTTGRQIRLHTDEPVPDWDSPGLRLPQVDGAVVDVTNGRVQLDTRVQLNSLRRTEIEWRIKDGRWATIQVQRGVLVARGFLQGFSGAHALTVHARATDGIPIIGDPLVPHYVAASWDAIFDAAEALTGGRVYSQFTRDLTPDYHWVCRPTGSAVFRAFRRFSSDGRVLGTHTTRGMDVPCTPPRYVPGTKRRPGRYLVQLVIPGKPRNGWFVSAQFAEEIIP